MKFKDDQFLKNSQNIYGNVKHHELDKIEIDYLNQVKWDSFENFIKPPYKVIEDISYK